MAISKHQLSTCLWMDTQAEQAAEFYTSLFPQSSIGYIARYTKEGFEHHHKPEGSVMTVDFTLAGQEFTTLNGGPEFKINPSISFFVMCETEQEISTLWEALTMGGSMLMPLDKYDWSERYGWAQDRFGVSWQVALGKISDVGQKITPSLLYVNEKDSKAAEEAIQLYTSLFENNKIDGILKYGPGEHEPGGTVKHAQFHLLGQTFMAMDSTAAHAFSFNEAVSIVINCENQEQIDHYWNGLTANGGQEQPCGWVKDKFGVSWQVTPIQLAEMMRDEDKEKSRRVTAAMFTMKKLDIATLEQAYKG